MTPKEKAIDLISKVHGVESAKLFADEMLENLIALNSNLISPFYKVEQVVFWQDVRIELNYIPNSK